MIESRPRREQNPAYRPAFFVFKRYLKLKTRKEITQLVQQMRKQQTKEEALLWTALRAKSLNGYKFLRQHPIVYGNNDKQLLFFVADFYCAKARLILEVDGKIHLAKKEYDTYREGVLVEMGYRILRIKNEELNNINTVLEKISLYI
jgi:very-short-patch-repair endonuclease